MLATILGRSLCSVLALEDHDIPDAECAMQKKGNIEKPGKKLCRNTTEPDGNREGLKQSFTKPVSLGRCLIGDIVSVSKAIDLGEGEDHK